MLVNQNKLSKFVSGNKSTTSKQGLKHHFYMIDVKETLKKSEERMEMAALFLEEELNRIRAGRANVAILDGVRVELRLESAP